jgi:homoserine dehydrogenase
MNIGIFGFGCVGQGLWQVLHETKGVKADIKKICIKNPGKKRPIDAAYFTTDPNVILDDPEIDVVVELTDDPEAAFQIVSRAMRQGKAAVSANKKMIAHRLPELYRIQQETGQPFLYEASCAASIPIIRNLEEYYDNDLLTSVEGILNGTTNYILTKIFTDKIGYQEALQQAQALGFAESDPTMDVEGYDAILHAFGVFVAPNEVFHWGINRLSDFDIQQARSRGCEIKLVARCFRQGERVAGWCMPRFVPIGARFATINNEYNAVSLESAFTETQTFVGKGAGAAPTGCAVLSDISALRYHYKYEYRKYGQSNTIFDTQTASLCVYVRYHLENDVNYSDFAEILEQYRSVSGNYLIGKINMHTLQNASWLKNEGVNLIEI